MTHQDFEQLQQLAPHLSAFRRVGVFSPLREGERKLFPKAVSLPRWRWDLNRPSRQRFDLLVACNVFMYSPDPALWFRNVLASCRYFLLLDLIRRQRDSHDEFGSDGDRMRYAVGDERPRVARHFDLTSLGDRVVGYRTFFGGANAQDNTPQHVVALIRGDLAEPILRIDDYPTGIRPILPNLSPLHDILRLVEARRLPYHLGIVPMLLTDEMCEFLNSLEHMIPVVHGYDHAYPKYAPLLQAKGDPFNQRTVGRFNEFAGRPYDEIRDRLAEARQRLEQRLGRPVDAYIPPCNWGDRKTGRALAAAGYQRYLSDKRIPGCPLPWIRTDFWGRAREYDYAREPDVVTLHVTWENDVVREGQGTDALERLLDHLAERRQQARATQARLGALFQPEGVVAAR